MAQFQDNKEIEKFVVAFQRQPPVYKFGAFTFVAIKSGEIFNLVGAKLQVSAWPIPPLRSYESDELVGGQYDLAALGLTADDFIKMLVDTCSIETAKGHFRLPPGDNGYNVHKFTQFNERDYPCVLRIAGQSRDSFNSNERLQELLVTGIPPFGTLDNLLGYFDLRLGQGALTVDVVVGRVLEIETPAEVKAGGFCLTVRRAPGLDQSKLGVNWLPSDGLGHGVTGDDIQWIDGEDRGVIVQSYLATSALSVITSYARIPQQTTRFSGLTDAVVGEGAEAATEFDGQGVVINNNGNFAGNTVIVYKALNNDVSNLIEAIKASNAPHLTEETKAQLSSELEAGATLAKAPKPNRWGLQNFLLRPIQWLASTAGKEIVGEVVSTLAKLVLKQILPGL